MTRSQELYEKWKNNGGNLYQYNYPIEIMNDSGEVIWVKSNERQYISSNGDKKQRTMNEKDEESYILWKNKNSNTWMHLKSSTSILSDSPVGFKAYVTRGGQHITVGINFVGSDAVSVIKSAANWMRNNPNGYSESE